MKTILYIHGMGGGSDSRIPSILAEALPYKVVCRTYSFDPEEAAQQIASWVEDVKPSLIIGESLGSLHALRVRGVPHILISPALNAPYFLHVLSWLTYIPGVTRIFDRIYKPREGDRQRLHFTKDVLRKYKDHARAAYANVPAVGSDDLFYAFIGHRDHYRRTGVVSIRAWKKHFGETFSLYDGTHFTEEEHINALVLPWIYNMLNINK
jgi:hypothetical protein